MAADENGSPRTVTRDKSGVRKLRYQADKRVNQSANQYRYTLRNSALYWTLSSVI